MKNLRNWATPLTIGSSLVMAVTGILMFFHLETMMGKVVHEWAGWLMVLGIVAHAALNWRPLTLYFKRRLAVGIIAGGVLITSLTLLPISGLGENPMQGLAMAALSAEAEVLMQLTGHTLQEGTDILAENGIILAPGQSLADVTGDDRSAQFGALSALLAK